MVRKRKRASSKRPVPWGTGYYTERVNADGRVTYQARWREGAKWRAKTVKSEQAAIEHLRSIADGRYEDPTTMTVQEMMLIHLERHERDWKPTTYDAYEAKMRLMINPWLGSKRIADLRSTDVQRWIDALAPSYAPETLKNARTLLSGALAEAERLGLIERNAAAGVSLPKSRPSQKVAWTIDQAVTVLAAVEHLPMYSAMYHVALRTGIRPGELRALRWSAIDLTAQTVRVHSTESRDRDGRRMISPTTKTGDDRTVPLTEPLIAALKRWRRYQVARRLKADAWDPRDFVFTGHNGGPLGATTWRKVHDRLLERLKDQGVPRITLHEMRHTAASIMSGIIIQDDTKALLGHKSYQTTTEHYVHRNMAELMRAMEAIDAALAGADTTTSPDETRSSPEIHAQLHADKA